MTSLSCAQNHAAMLEMTQIPLGSSRRVSTQLDTFDVSNESRRDVLFDKLDTGKMHGLDTSNVSSRVET